jgi:hypothetical protein
MLDVPGAKGRESKPGYDRSNHGSLEMFAELQRVGCDFKKWLLAGICLEGSEGMPKFTEPRLRPVLCRC